MKALGHLLALRDVTQWIGDKAKTRALSVINCIRQHIHPVARSKNPMRSLWLCFLPLFKSNPNVNLSVPLLQCICLWLSSLLHSGTASQLAHFNSFLTDCPGSGVFPLYTLPHQATTIFGKHRSDHVVPYSNPPVTSHWIWKEFLTRRLTPILHCVPLPLAHHTTATQFHPFFQNTPVAPSGALCSFFPPFQ